MRTAIHVAVADNGVIGREGALPWRLSTDLRRFKRLTMGKPVILGRKTFEGLGRPLPGRLNIVVTGRTDFRADGVEIVHSLGDALRLATVRSRCEPAADEICIIGGGRIYAQAIGLVDRLFVTHVQAEIEGDTVFPPIEPAVWVPVHVEEVPAGEKDTHATRFTIYERRRPSSAD